MSKTLIVGLPPTFSGPNLDEVEVARENLLWLYLVPMKVKMVSPGSKDAFRIFRLVPISPEDKGAPQQMEIYFEPTNIEETFSNEMTEHFLSQILRVSERMGQVFQSTGLELKDLGKAAKNVAEKIPGLNALKEYASKTSFGKFAGNMTEAIAGTLSGHRFDFPKMWADSRSELTRDISFKLFCNNPDDDKSFEKYIVRPLENILKFVLPISEGSAHYKWPYLCTVKAPGLFYLPEAIVTNVSLNKGMGVNFGINNRPNVVEVAIQFTSIRNVMVNDVSKSTGFSYTLQNYVSNLKDKNHILQTKISNLSVDHTSKKVKQISKQIPPEKVTDQQKAANEGLKPYQPVII